MSLWVIFDISGPLADVRFPPDSDRAAIKYSDANLGGLLMPIVYVALEPAILAERQHGG